MIRLRIFSIFALLMLSACSAGADSSPTPDGNAAATSAFATAFAYLTETSIAGSTPTLTETPTFTPQPPTLTPSIVPTTEPVTGMANTNVTVRSEARKGADNLGGVFTHQGVQVIARNDAATWYYIQWDKSPTGTAWVLGHAIDLKDTDMTLLPIAIYDNDHKIVVLPALIWVITGNPLPLNPPAPGAKTASVTQLAKVRVGPGIGYSIMGNLNIGTVVTVTGHTDGNDWIQIEYPSGPDGHGWVSGELTHMNTDLGGVPFYNMLGTPASAEQAPAATSTIDPNATPEPTQTPAPTLAGPPGVVYKASEINVHSGPASSYALLGSLKLGDKVVVTGLTLNKLWYQIVYSAGPGGYGWVSTQYIRITGGDMTKLPYFDTLGTPLPK